ncbi:MAG: hypothetical protein HYR55_15575 [Acidobacteria bacterium]|nr:hypothetical protein [Acidobacteriota bacterium]MBI3655193.1 hypothetical protein [Acidobacteriota bacterium]
MRLLTVFSVLFYFAAGAGIIFFITNFKLISKRTKLFLLNASYLSAMLGLLLTRLAHGYFSPMSLVTLLSLMSSYVASIYAVKMRK